MGRSSDALVAYMQKFPLHSKNVVELLSEHYTLAPSLVQLSNPSLLSLAPHIIFSIRVFSGVERPAVDIRSVRIG